MAVFRRRQFSAEKGICHMQEKTITQLPDPSGFGSDAFTDVLRDGARKLIEQAIQAELATLMAAFPKEASPTSAHISGCRASSARRQRREYPSCARGFFDPEAVTLDERVGGFE